MPQPLRGASCLKPAILTTSGISHVWISDDLLSTAFRNFSHCHRRYGSNVPGPMEARRRSTKRKNTNLAHHDLGGQSIEAALLFGEAPHGKWWQRAPVQPASQSSSRLLPTWLFQSPNGPAQANAELAQSQKVRSTQPAELDARFAEEVRGCKTLRSIHRVIKSLQINLRTHPRFAEAAFQHLLHLYWSDNASHAGTIAACLSDPWLNPPGSQNLRMFIKELHGRSITVESWDEFLMPAFQNAIRLGLVAAEALSWILLELPRTMKSCGLSSKLENDLPISDWHHILTSINQCEVLNINDLGERVRNQWVAMLSKTGTSENTAKLLFRLQSKSQQMDPEVFADIVIAKLKESFVKGMDTSAAFLDLASSLSPDANGAAVLLTSQKLVAATLDGQGSGLQLDSWYHVLTTMCSDSKLSLHIDQKVWNTATATLDSPLTPLQNLLIVAWTISCLSAKRVPGIQPVTSFGFVQQARALFDGQKIQKPNEMLNEVVLCLQSLPLPGKELLYQELSQLSGANLVSSLKVASFDSAISKFAKKDFRILHDDQFFHWAERNFPDTLEEIAQSINSNIAGFRRTGRLLITNDKQSMKVIRRILKYNLPLKLAASGWPNDEIPDSSIATAKSGLDQKAVVRLINDLATATATTPVLGNRSAFRHVYWFYLWLHQHGAPIQKPMSKALWHAGVARYGDGGCPSTQMKFCLEKVREIEGSKVADLLMWNNAYRKTRAAEMITTTSPVSVVDSSHQNQNSAPRHIPVAEKKRAREMHGIGKKQIQRPSRIEHRA